MKDIKMNPRDPKSLRDEMLSGRDDIAGRLYQDFKDDFDSFFSLMAECYKFDRLFLDLEEQTEQTSAAGGLTFQSVDTLFTSVQLLICGFIVPSNHMFRQSFEALFLLTLVCEKETVRIEVDGKTIERLFYKSYNKKKNYTYANRAYAILEYNAELLNIDLQAFQSLKNIYLFYNKFSHPSDVSMTSRIDHKNGFIYVGAQYSNKDSNQYKVELDYRVRFTEILLTSMKHNIEKLKA